MLDNNLIHSTSSWPFVEVRKLLKDRKDLIKAKNKIQAKTYTFAYYPDEKTKTPAFGLLLF